MPETLEDVPMLARFFRASCDVVGMASFQVHAVTRPGRVARRRDSAGHAEAIAERIRQGVGLPRLAWDTAMVGHPSCNRGTMLAIAGEGGGRADGPPSLRGASSMSSRHVPFDRRDVETRLAG